MAGDLMQEVMERVQHVKMREWVVFAAIIWLLYLVLVGVYRVWFHPLAKFPGPKLAALTFWYEFYYELYPHQYRYVWKIKELHEQYGPIVRINPIHLHIHDPTYFDTIYASGPAHKRDRCSWMQHTGSKALSGGMLDTMDHDKHRMRRGVLSAFFSKRSVLALGSLIVEATEKLLERFEGERIAGTVVNLNHAYAAFTMDVISEYSYGESMGKLDREAYAKDFLKTMHGFMKMRPVGRQFPWLINTLLDMPPWLLEKMDETATEFTEFNLSLVSKIERIMKGNENIGGKEGRRTIFHDVRDDVSSALSQEEKAPLRLMADASVLMGAGTETTARTLAVMTYYLIQHPEIGDRLREELVGVMPTKDTKVTLPQLEALPYLSAVITEGLRTAHGVSSRQPRIATQEDLHYSSYTIPRGTAVMQSAYLLHTDPSIYPNPLAFRPERWLENLDLKRYWFAFGRGSRSCLGMNLAMSELYFGMALVWRRYRMEVFETVEKRDVWTSRDCFIGMAQLASVGIRVRIVGEVEEGL